MKKQSGKDNKNRRRSGSGGALTRLFSADNPLMKALAVAADLMLLNLLTVIVSIPVVTLGAAFTAMNDITIRIVRGEEGYIIRPFFRAFADNFKRGVLISLILAGSAAFLYFDYLAALTYIPELKVAIIAIAVIILAISFYLFALQARYENTFRATLKNAAVLSVGYFPRTLAMVVCSVGLWLVCIHFYQFGIPVLLLFGLSLPCYVNILLLNGVFRKLEGDVPEEEDKEDE